MTNCLKLFLILLLSCCTFRAAGQITAGFTPVFQSGCPPLVVHFANTSSGGPVRSHWQFDLTHAADTSNVTNPIWIYNTPGYYDVKLVVANAFGQVDSITIPHAIHVTSPPVVRFTASDTALLCPPATVNFTNRTDTGDCPKYYTWFIDSARVYTTNASYTFTTPGNYNISLSAIDSCGCAGSATRTAYVHVDSMPRACFFTADTDPCNAPATVCFNNCSSGAANYLWHFGDGTTDTSIVPCHIYTTTGNYSDTLVARTASGCSSTAIRRNYIHVGHTSFGFYTSPALICTGSPISCVDTSIASGYHLWRFNGADTNAIRHEASPTYTYDLPGTYTITDSAWNSSGCAGVSSTTIVVRQSPDASFFADNPHRCLPPDTVTFHASTSAIGSIASYLWDFGDTLSHATATTPSPTYIYTTYGAAYSPSLTLVDTVGCTATSSLSNYVSIGRPADTLVIDRHSNRGCVPDTVDFHTEFTPAVSFVTDSITFGDGTVDTVASGQHVYTRPGNFVMRHYYHLLPGCTGSSPAVRFALSAAPSVTLTAAYDTICPSIPDLLIGTCSGCTSGSWDRVFTYRVRDTAIGRSRVDSFITDTITRTFFQPGVDSFFFTAVNGACVVHEKDSVFVHSPYTSWTVSQPDCHDTLTLKFTFSSFPYPTSTKWFFGDGDSSSLLNPVHTFPHYGTFGITLLDTNSVVNCYNSRDDRVDIFQFPTSVSAADSILCLGQWVSIPTHYFQFYSFIDYGDGAGYSDSILEFDYFSPRVEYTHIYPSPGVYSPTVIFMNKFQCRDTITQLNLVRVTSPGGGLWADPTLGCAPLTVNLHDSDLYPTPVATVSRRWIWAVGDTTFGTRVADTSHYYLEGNYTVTLIDLDANGCVTVDSVAIAAVKPHAYFTTDYEIACTNVSLSFVDTNTFVSYRWLWGDGSAPGTGAAPTHVYTANGVYSNTVIITTIAGGRYPVGCVDTLTRTDYIVISDTSIHPGFNLSDTLAGCPPLIVTATNTSTSSAGLYYKWKYGFDSTTINYTLTNATAVYNYPGFYTITLLDSSAVGCRDSIKHTVHVNGPTGTLTFAPDSICVGGSFALHFTSGGTAALDSYYIWSMPPYGAFTTDTPGFNIRYFSSGAYNPYVLVNSRGCQVAVHTTDSLHIFPLPVVTVTEPSVTCGFSVQLLASGAITYTWTPATGLSCTACGNPSASPTSPVTYTVVGTARNGCSDTATTFVIVDRPHYITFTGRSRICLGDCDTLTPSGVMGTFIWSGNAMSCSLCSQVVVCPVETSVYTVVATDSFGCRDTGTFRVNVEPLPIISYSPNPAYSCIDMARQIKLSGATSYSWLPHVGLSCDTCGAPMVMPPNSLVYTVTATSYYGCKSVGKVPVTVFEHTHSEISGDTTICKGDMATLHARGAEKYRWINGWKLNDPTIPDPVATPDSTFTYILIATENVCYKDTLQVTVTVAPLPAFNIPVAYTIIAGTEVQLNAHVTNSVHTKYTWTPAEHLTCANCPSPIANPELPVIYTVTAISGDGCAADTTIYVNTYCDESQVFIPNSFTPNQDGLNDRFYVSGRGIKLVKHLVVFNRWGEIVFERQNTPANDPIAGWDGSYKGSDLPPDSFIFTVEAECALGSVFSYRGNISIVR